MAKAIRASVLVFLLACSAQAGHIHNDVIATPPPTPPPSVMQAPTDDPTLNGEMHTPGDIQNDAPAGLTQTALDLLALLPSLL